MRLRVHRLSRHDIRVLPALAVGALLAVDRFGLARWRRGRHRMIVVALVRHRHCVAVFGGALGCDSATADAGGALAVVAPLLGDVVSVLGGVALGVIVVVVLELGVVVVVVVELVVVLLAPFPVRGLSQPVTAAVASARMATTGMSFFMTSPISGFVLRKRLPRWGPYRTQYAQGVPAASPGNRRWSRVVEGTSCRKRERVSRAIG